MNKIFKVIWSKARGCYVVASEFAKSHTKSGRAVKAVAMAAAVALTVGVNGLALAEAANPAGEGLGVTIGQGSETKYKNDVALGENATTITDAEYTDDNGIHSGGNTAIGAESKAIGVYSTAFGIASSASGTHSTSIGVHAAAEELDSTAIGNYAKASGSKSTAIGNVAIASGEGSLAAGVDSKATGKNNTALGDNAQATEGEYSTAIGVSAKASNVQSTAAGINSVASGAESTALGGHAKAEGKTSTALGASTTASKENSTAAGIYATASGKNGTAIGHSSKANGATNSTAVGSNAEATASYSTALGKSAKASGDYSIATGLAAKASGYRSLATGTNSIATSNNSIAIGTNALTGDVQRKEDGNIDFADDQSVKVTDKTAVDAVAIGNGSWAAKKQSTAMGASAKARGENSTAAGIFAEASGLNSTASGVAAKASGKQSTAIGHYTVAGGEDSVAIGSQYTTANGKGSVAVGETSVAAGENALAFGASAVTGTVKRDANTGKIEIDEKGNVTILTSAANAVAIGDNANAVANYSTALGSGAKALKRSSVAMGANATAGEIYSTAVGYTATASGQYSTASGGNATASGDYSMAVGYNAKASEKLSTALGYEAKANGVNNVALGANSSDEKDDNIHLGGYGAGDETYTGEVPAFGTSDGSLKLNASSFTGIGGSVVGTVSVGSAGNERTLTNVAAGMISKDSTDAINGSQLYAVADALNTKVNNLPEQKHTVNGNDKKVGETADAPVVNKGQYVGGNLLIKADQDTATGDITYDISLNKNLIGLESITVNDMTVNNELKVGKTVSISDNSVKFGNVEIQNDYITNVKTNINDNSSVVNVESLNKEINKITNIIDDLNIPNNQLHTVNGNDNANNPGHGTTPTNDGKYNDTGNLLINQNVAADGTVTYDISLNKDLTVNSVTSNNFYAGDTVINNNGITIGKGDKNIQITNDYVSFGDRVINNVVTDGKDGHEVVNIDYLEEYVNNYVTNHSDDTDTHIKEGEYSVGTVTLEDGSETQGVQMDIVDKTGNHVKDEKGNNKTVTITDVAKASDVGDVKNFNQDVLNQNGSKTTVVDAINNIDNRVTEIDNKVTNIDNRVTNIEDNIDDIAKEAGKHTEVTVEGGDAPKYGEGYVGGNLQLKVDKGANGQNVYDVKLNNNLDLTGDGSIKFGDKNTYIDGNRIDVGNTHITNNNITMGDTVITNNKVTTNEVQTGNTTVNNNGLTIKGDENHTDITINQGDVSMGGNVIHNVAPGVKDDDAVNVSQLKELNQNIENNSYHINKLKGRIDKVGAGAAALAALHPLDFDPDDKFYLSAGYGHYRGENAVAVGAFYQPNDDTLFSISSTVGNDDDMINAGITWRFGQQSHQSRSKKAMAKEIIELRTEIAELKAMVYSLTGYGLDLEKSKLFPDTPENHWAYDYVAVVAGNGILEGYPDGYFDGDRPMTRYEMAAVVYRLLQKGVQVDNRMIQEFAPELARVRVDTLTHYNDGTPHIQRVRVIKGRG